MIIDNLDIIKKLIADAESSNVEFKETTGQLERGMETLCAFLNSSEGTILFGVTDKGNIIGQEVADSTKRNIAEAIKRIEPSVMVQVTYIPLPETEKKIIALHVDDNMLNRPFSYKGRAYMRVESVTTTMPQTVYNELLLQRDGNIYRWETFENRHLTLRDIDNNEVLKTVRLGIECGRLPEDTGSDIPVILEKFKLMRDGILNNAAAVLFANKELIDYPQCLLRLARFKGTDKTVFMDSQRITGNLFQQLNAAMAFVFKHLSLSGTTDKLEREEQLAIPYKAIREGILNSCTHRSYSEAGGSIGIAIYDDRVEIENPGTFPTTWSLEKVLTEHGSKPHNPIIADVLYKRKFLENWGRGIGMILSECQKANLPQPEYKLDADSVRLIFKYNPIMSIDRPSDQATKHRTSKRVDTEKVSKQTPTKHRTSTDQATKRPTKYRISKQPDTDKLSDQKPDIYRPSTSQEIGRVQAVVKTLEKKGLTLKEIMEILGLRHRYTFMTNYLHPALNRGYIIKLFPDEPNHPKQKYYLSEKGRALLEQE